MKVATSKFLWHVIFFYLFFCIRSYQSGIVILSHLLHSVIYIFGFCVNLFCNIILNYVECGQYLVDDINNVEGIKYIDLFLF
jgi:hypothetical protein